ncbi:uncharacterized protein LOC132707878 [Cylas formicarius]|uniref:uncharacterized protein LOC132707878 n=1 Tax=Cylas formicarius TaxID=197179 RepID=UPI002958C11A|nr:uncharacterized protein LOC132707878 [Cylas formicarius]
MIAKTLCIITVFLACPVHPAVHLTREIQLTPADLCSPRPTPFETFVGRVADSRVVESLVDSFLASQADTLTALQDKIASNSEDLVGILEILNDGAGAEVLRVDDGFVGVDPGELERFAIAQARTLSRALFPRDPFRQIIFFSSARVQIRGVAASIAPRVLNIRVPLKALAAVLPPLDRLPSSHAISKRDVSLAELLWSVVQTTVCQTIRPAVAIVNGTILRWEDFLDNLTVETEVDNPLSIFLADLVRSVFAAARELLANVRAAIGGLASAVCASGSSRRKRDVGTDLVADGYALQQRSVSIFTILGGVLAFVWTTLLAPVVNVAAKAFVARAVSFLTDAIDTFLNTTFVDAANTIIDTITNQ